MSMRECNVLCIWFIKERKRTRRTLSYLGICNTGWGFLNLSEYPILEKLNIPLKFSYFQSFSVGIFRFRKCSYENRHWKDNGYVLRYPRNRISRNYILHIGKRAVNYRKDSNIFFGNRNVVQESYKVFQPEGFDSTSCTNHRICLHPSFYIYLGRNRELLFPDNNRVWRFWIQCYSIPWAITLICNICGMPFWRLWFGSFFNQSCLRNDYEQQTFEKNRC